MKGKRKFKCGHRGLGRWCHRCKQAEVCERAADGNAPIGSGVEHKYHASGDFPFSNADWLHEATRLRRVAS